MTERPILFNAPMVRAILDGSKTQTRRVITNHPGDQWTHDGFGRITSKHPKQDRFGLFVRRGLGTDFPECDIVPCPYGQPGDQLWVREAWARTTVGLGTEMVVYREGDNRTDYGGPWKPGIHMFRRDSRISLEITRVRVERLQDISEGDTIAEGVSVHPDHHGRPRESIYSPVQAYRDLWESINGPDSWSANPWVWVVEFTRTK